MTTTTRTHHHYAYDWQYGINVCDFNHQPLAELHIFDSQAERDAWVNDDTFDGNYHRSAVDASEARRAMVSSIPTDMTGKSMSELVDAYRAYDF